MKHISSPHNRDFSLFLPLVTVVLSAFAVSNAQAQDAWDGGGADDNLSTDLNWVDDTAPTGGDITFGGETRLTPNNDFVGATFGPIGFTNDGSVGNAGSFTLSGNSMTLGGNIIATQMVEGGTVMTDIIHNDIVLNANRAVLADANHNITLTGDISGAFSLTAGGTNNNGLNTLSGDNSHSQTSIGRNGQLRLTTNTAGGDLIFLGRNTDLFLSDGLLINPTNGIVFQNSANSHIIQVTDAGATSVEIASLVDVQISGVANSRTASLNVGDDDTLTLSGQLTSSNTDTTKRLLKGGAGTLILSNGTNDYEGILRHDNGTVELQHPLALQAARVQMNGGSVSFDEATVSNAATFGTIHGSSNLSLQTDTGGALALTLAGPSSDNYSGVISDNGIGGGSIIKTGAGTQVFSGTNTYGGTTTISEGILRLGNAGTTGSLVATTGITNNADLKVNRTNAFTQATDLNGQAITGTGSFDQTGTGTTTLSAANTYTGATTVTTGTLELTGSLTSDISVTAGATLSGPGSTTGVVTIADSGTLVGGGSAGGLLTLGDGLGTGAIFDASGGTFTSDGLTTNVAGGNVSVIASGFGVIDLFTYGAGSGVFTGNLSDFTVTSGLGGHGSAGLFSDDGTTISFDTGADSNNVWGGTTDGTWEIGGSNSNWQSTYADGLFYDFDAVTFDDTGIAQSTVTLSTSVTPTSMAFGNTTNPYVINDNGSAETITLVSGISSTANGDVTINAQLAGTGGVSHTGTGTFILAGDNTLTGDNVIGVGSTLQIGNAAGTGLLNGDTVNDGALIFNRTGASTYSGGMSGSGALTHSGSGTTTFNGTSSFTGGVTLNDGTLNVQNSNALGTGTITLVGGKLYDSGGTVNLANTIDATGSAAIQASFGNLNLNGAITGSGTLNFGGVAESSSVVIADDLSGFTGTITHDNVNADNNLTLTGAVNTTASFSTSGATSSNRHLNFNGGATIGELSGTGGRVRSSFLLTVNQDTSTSYAGVLANTGTTMSLEKQGTGTLTLTGTNTFTGSVTATGGSLVMHRSAIVNGTPKQYTVNSPATLDFFIDTGLGTTVTAGFKLAGNGTFKKTGPDTFNHYSSGSDIAMGAGGLIWIAEGTWNFGGATAGTWASNLSDLQVDGGATIEGRATAIRVDALDGAGTVGIDALVVGVDDGSGSFSGVIQNTSADGTAFSLEKQGTGTQTLSGVNTYTGDTTVNAGTLTLADGGRLTFVPTVDTDSNQIGGTGNLNLDGEIYFDLSGADLSDGNSWQIVDVTNLTEVYGGTFSVNSSLGAFTDDAGVWTFVDGAYEWTFSQATGSLSLGFTTFGAWATAAGATLDMEANDDVDSMVNLLEFAFGTDPLVSDASALKIDGSSFTAGTPVVDISYNPTLEVKARFIRRTDHATAGITYTVQFSNDLSGWEAIDEIDGATAVIVPGTSASGDYEAVEVDYPLFLDSGKKAYFFRLSINDVNAESVTP